MAFVFRPAVWRGGMLHELPRPVPVLRIQETWDAEKFKVPLVDGDRLVGLSRNGVDIVVQGQVGSQAGSLKLTEEAMATAIEALRTALHVSADDDFFWLFVFYDAATSTYRHFRQCSTVKFEWDLSDGHLFTYAATIHAQDPVLHTTGPE